jgi:hypothetical protein
MGRSELIQELDTLEASRELFMGIFELLGGSRRGHGGQGIVQVWPELSKSAKIRNYSK